MSAESAGAPGQGAGQPSEEELRAAYEAELSRITITDMIAQSAVSLLNLGARRLGLGGEPGAEDAAPSAAPERDLEQVRDAIDGVRALLEILERRIPQELRGLRDALSQLQMAYAREVAAAGGAPPPPADPPAPPSGAPGVSGAGPGAGGSEETPGPAQSSGRLWVPGS